MNPTLNQSTTPMLPNDGVLFSVTRGYDMRGRARAIGTPADAEAFAIYGYNAVGTLRSEVLGPGLPRPIERSYTYDAQQRLVQIDDPFSAESYFHTMNGDGTGPEADGRVTGETIAFKAPQFQTGAMPRDYGYHYAYSPLGPLTKATATDLGSHVANPEWSFALEQRDADDSAMEFSLGPTSQTARRNPDTHQVTSITAGSQPTQAYAYSPNGCMVSRGVSQAQQIVYGNDDKVARVLSDEVDVSYCYSSSRAAVKTSIQGNEEGKRFFFSTGPFAEMECSGPDGAPRFYVAGPRGIFATVMPSEQVSFRTLDRLGSTRVVTDGDGTGIGCFNYLPFGQDMPGNSTMLSPAAAEADVLQRYIGSEWESDLAWYDCHARKYLPEALNFTASDPLLEFSNPYSYCGLDPVNLSDRLGLAVEVVEAMNISSESSLESSLESSTDSSLFANRDTRLPRPTETPVDPMAGKVEVEGFVDRDAPITDPKNVGFSEQIYQMFLGNKPFWRSLYATSLAVRVAKLAIRSVYSGIYQRQLESLAGVKGKSARRAALGMAIITLGLNIMADVIYQKSFRPLLTMQPAQNGFDPPSVRSAAIFLAMRPPGWLRP